MGNEASEFDAAAEPGRILIIKPSALGDIVHALPILGLLRRKWPRANISWLVTPAFAGLLEGHPQLDEVIRFERRRFGAGWRDPMAAMGFVQFVLRLRKRNFDLVIDLQGLFRSGCLAGMTGAANRIGFANAREGAWLFYNRRVEVGNGEQHALDRYLAVADALGCGRAPLTFTFPTDEADRRFIADLIADAGPYAVLLPGTNWPTKRWPPEHFAALIEPLQRRHGLRTVLAGGPDVIGLAGQIREIAGKTAVLDLSGKTDLRQLVALLEQATFVVANDSGPMHIASALGRPMLTLFGPTNPVRTGPYGRIETVMRLDIVCSPCYARRCAHQSCLRWLGAEAVMEAIDEQLRNPNDVTRKSESMTNG